MGAWAAECNLGAMTELVPPQTPLLTQERLAIWAQERPLADPDFADLVIEAVSTLVRQYGSETWEPETLPPRARDIAYIVAKDYYLNPGLLRSETTGPITETRAEAVLQGLSLTPEQQAELHTLALTADVAVDGLWTLGFSRGPVETHRRRPHGTVLIWDTRGAWPIEFLDESERDVFGFSLEEPTP